MAVSQHDSNRTDAADLFINDFSSKNDVQQKLKKREDEAAELKRKEAAAKQAEADRRVKEAAITKQLEELKQENGQLVTKKKELEANVKSGIEREQQLTAQRDQANQKASLLQAAADERERMKPNPDNDLPADFHGKLVTFINSGSKTAVDMGDGKLPKPNDSKRRLSMVSNADFQRVCSIWDQNAWLGSKFGQQLAALAAREG